MQHQTLTLLRLILTITVAAFSSIASAQSQAVLESPTAGAFVQSGVGLIRGWACEAQRVEISIDGQPLQAIAYGTERLDTQPVCGDSNNGFGFTQNWNRVGDGVHNLRAFIDGVEFANVNFTVTTLGREFLTGLRAQYTLQNFPSAGVSPQVLWSETHQNFVFTRQVTIPTNTPPSDNPRVKLESPSQGSHESGIGLIRGWACEASQIEIRIDGGARQAIAYGTERLDTQPVCGDSNNGFGFTQNWNRVGDGTHNLRAYRDGVEFANVNFAVTTLGREEFLTGLSSQLKFNDFPETGQITTAEWSEPQQNFIVARSTATPSRLALIAAITDALNPMAVAGNGTGAALGESTGIIAAKRGDGLPTRLEGITWASSPTGQSADLQLADDGLPVAYTDSSGMEARFSDYQLTDAASSVTVSFFRNGAAQGNPVTVPVEGAGLRALQTMAERVRLAVQSAPTSTGRQVAPAVSTASARQTQDTTPSRFTLSALLVNSYWYGSVAASDTLCAVRAAAEQTGVSGLVAPAACQSPLIAAFLARAATRRGAAAEPPASGIDPLVQQALQADADVPVAPCGPAGGGVSCLTPVTTQLQTRQRESAQLPTLPREEPPEPPVEPTTPPESPHAVTASDGDYIDRVTISWDAVEGAVYYEVYRSTSSVIAGNLLDSNVSTTQFDDFTPDPGTIYWYSVRACNSAGCSVYSTPDSGYIQSPIRSYVGTSTICFTATANYGVQGSCPQRCASADASATLQNELLTLKRTSFSFIYNFDSRGNCTEATLTRSGDVSYTPNAVDGRFSYSYSIYQSGSRLAGVNMQGSYSNTSLSASGSVRYSAPLSNEQSATIDFEEDISMKSSSP
ncbi:MAG: fibronectin type III domain-containing protein [Candidatus Competibacteraceae bacterium]|nr:fibronectin type III domain-containing protein [Candidatus Competibacteraceae bacterium]